MQPELAILDWEHWGAAPVGYDAALLYCSSLRSRETAARVRQTFADLLDTPDGMLAELYAIARLLLRIERGDHPTLTIPLHRRASQLVTA